MPVGGQSSFYADWYSPARNNAGPPITYKVGDVPDSELPGSSTRRSRSSRPAARPLVCRWPVRIDDPVGLPPAAVHLRRSLSGFLNPSEGSCPS